MKIEKLDNTPSHRTKTAKRSILKVKGVSDPAISRKHSVKMITNKALRKQRRETRKRIDSMKKEDIDRISKKSNLSLNPNTPAEIKKQILYHGVSAGFVSLD
jgi:hypothetical protein